MNPALHTAIENLYAVFSVYPLNLNMSGCPCCVSEQDIRNLCSQPLRELEPENLRKYFFKAMTTWGNASDFKHFLPRISELVALDADENEGIVTLLRKISYDEACWSNWPEPEKLSVNTFTLEYWKDLVHSDRNSFPRIEMEALLAFGFHPRELTDI